MYRWIENKFKSIGVVQSPVRYEEALEAGFLYGLWWKEEPRPIEREESLRHFLTKIALSMQGLRKLPSDRERMNAITNRLQEERHGLQNWFKLGMWTFAVARTFGSEHYAETTEAAQALLQEDQEVRGVGSNFINALLAVGYSPDDAERFFLDKIVPFLYEPGLRRWVDSPHIAIMTDLKFKAKAIDAEITKDSDKNRLVAASRALISEIPVIGKALETIIFGVKK